MQDGWKVTEVAGPLGVSRQSVHTWIARYEQGGLAALADRDVFVDGSLIQVWSKNHLVKTVARTRTGPVRKVRADGLHVKDQPNTKRQASAGT